MEIMQPDEKGDFKVKMTNFFQGPQTKEPLHGFPKPDGNTENYSKDDWKIYFLTVRKFLINYAKENMCPKLVQIPQRMPRTLEEQEGNVEYPTEEFDPSKILF